MIEVGRVNGMLKAEKEGGENENSVEGERGIRRIMNKNESVLGVRC
jgi:hypothetical protein